MRAGAAHACGLENSAAFVLRSYGVLSKARAAARHTRRLGGGLSLTEAELSPWGESGRGEAVECSAVMRDSTKPRARSHSCTNHGMASMSPHDVTDMSSSAVPLLQAPARLFLFSRLQLRSREA